MKGRLYRTPAAPGETVNRQELDALIPKRKKDGLRFVSRHGVSADPVYGFNVNGSNITIVTPYGRTIRMRALSSRDNGNGRSMEVAESDLRELALIVDDMRADIEKDNQS